MNDQHETLYQPFGFRFAAVLCHALATPSPSIYQQHVCRTTACTWQVLVETGTALMWCIASLMA